MICCLNDLLVPMSNMRNLVLVYILNNKQIMIEIIKMYGSLIVKNREEYIIILYSYIK